MQATTVDPAEFRRVMSTYPTGVTVVTAVDTSGSPVGMAVGTFLSVSLDPPLVGFLPARSSTTFPRIRSAGSFCVNVLAEGQEELCRRFSARGGDKFAGLEWEPAPSGAPRLAGSAAWIDCLQHGVADAGDHHFVTGAVQSMADGDGRGPLLFHRGTLGRMAQPDIRDESPGTSTS